MSAVHVLGAWRNEDSRYVRVSGQWRRVVGMAVRVAGAWHSVGGYAPAFSASAPSNADGTRTLDRPSTVQVTTSAAITISGGASPYTYQWTRTGGDARITISGATMAQARFSATLREETAEAVFGWVATDAAGQTASGSVDVTLTAESLS